MPRPGAANQPWSDVVKAGKVWKADAHSLRKQRILDTSLLEANNKGSFLANVQNNACANIETQSNVSVTTHVCNATARLSKEENTGQKPD